MVAVASLAKSRAELAAANQNQPAAAGRDFLHIRDAFSSSTPSFGGNDNHRHVLGR